MSGQELLFKIVDTLETAGLSRDEYQLHRVIDVEALEQLADSSNDELEIRFSVGEFRVLVTQSDVRVLTDP
ncbi:HalOD1 output domain-containing protein [Natrinema versiforme]|uniref:HalOD1 output domain-containing protein n=1 Tax=Natrinema versiforme TaxID=88724 RepID=UPI0009FCCFC7|nr:HalOD1 output domain-containing protein [Natrinema versiforme]